jgi:hypothetical protein
LPFQVLTVTPLLVRRNVTTKTQPKPKIIVGKSGSTSLVQSDVHSRQLNIYICMKHKRKHINNSYFTYRAKWRSHNMECYTKTGNQLLRAHKNTWWEPKLQHTLESTHRKTITIIHIKVEGKYLTFGHP